MRLIFLSLITLVSNLCVAIECSYPDKYSRKINEHVDIASKIFLGAVTKSEFDMERNPSYGDQISVNFSVIQNFKGTEQKSITVKSSPESLLEPISIGFSYVVFLYEDNYLDSVCGYVIPFGYYVDSIEIMKRVALEVDDSYKKIRNDFVRLIQE